MRFAEFIKRRSGWLAVLAAGFVASCVVVEDGPRPLPPRPGPGPVMCTQQYDPVCATRGNRQQTFGNACTANAEGFNVAYRGECQAQRPGRPGPGTGGPGAGRPDRPGAGGGFCTREYRPVCATRGNRQQTFGNACEAESAGWRIRRNGEC